MLQSICKRFSFLNSCHWFRQLCGWAMWTWLYFSLIWDDRFPSHSRFCEIAFFLAFWICKIPNIRLENGDFVCWGQWNSKVERWTWCRNFSIRRCVMRFFWLHLALHAENEELVKNLDFFINFFFYNLFSKTYIFSMGLWIQQAKDPQSCFNLGIPIGIGWLRRSSF